MQAKIIRRIFPFLSNYVYVTRKKDVVDLLNHYPAPTSSGCRPLLPLDLPRRSSLRGERLQALSSNRSGFLQAPARTPSFKSVIPKEVTHNQTDQIRYYLRCNKMNLVLITYLFRCDRPAGKRAAAHPNYETDCSICQG